LAFREGGKEGLMPEFQWLRRLTEGRVAREEPPDPLTQEREVYERLYGERSSRLSVIETPAEEPEETAPRPRRRAATKPPTPSRALS
jgi:hypothetical protein